MAFSGINKHPLRWTNGMKISADHFINTDNAWQENVRDTRCLSLHDFRYGIIANIDALSENSPNLFFDANNSRLILKACSAVTIGGYRIEINENQHTNHQIPLELPSANIDVSVDAAYHIYIFVDMYNPQDAGKVVNDTPSRYQNVTYQYELSVVNKKDATSALTSAQHLKIGELRVQNQSVVLLNDSGDYIPPCFSIESHPQLRKYHDTFASRMKNIQQNALQIIRNTNQVEGAEVQEVRKFAERIIFFIAGELFSFKIMMPSQAPITMLAYCKDFAQYIWLSMEMHGKSKILQKHIQHYTLTDAINNVYAAPEDHLDIAPSLIQAALFLERVEKLCNALSLYGYDNRDFIIRDNN